MSQDMSATLYVLLVCTWGRQVHGWQSKGREQGEMPPPPIFEKSPNDFDFSLTYWYWIFIDMTGGDSIRGRLLCYINYVKGNTRPLPNNLHMYVNMLLPRSMSRHLSLKRGWGGRGNVSLTFLEMLPSTFKFSCSIFCIKGYFPL